jgi:response regulator of citrate/malate metabolism
VISGGQDLDFVVKCLRSGADDFIVKPAMMETLRNVWRSAWRRRNFELQLHSEQRELQDQVAVLQTQMHEAVETPINVILRTINDLAKMDSLKQDVRDALSSVVKSLNSSNLYRPVMQEKAVNVSDGTTRKWLSSVCVLFGVLVL